MQQQTFTFEPLPPASHARRNVVIEAGAGTGKTTAIVAEVLGLMLEREELDPQRIVLMTFTEKAAGEIADRIRIALQELGTAEQRTDGKIVWPLASAHPLVSVDDTPSVRRAIEHHLANVDALRSQTIHSFCQSILRSFPIEAGLDPQFKIVQGFERALLYGRLYDSWLDDETRVHPVEEFLREWELLFTHAGYLFTIRDLILALIDRRDLLGETDYDFGDFERDVLPVVHRSVQWIRDAATAACKDAAATRVAEYIRGTSFSEGSIDEWIEFFQPIASSIREVKLPGCGGLKEPMQKLRGDTNDSIYDRLVSHRASMALLALTRRFVSWLDAEKRKLGVVDFDDLLLRTLTVLEDPQVLSRARSQFDFIFVDEFQDTDRTQARIIERLARDSSGVYVPGKTIVVGDPKQSIYGFRRADPETYYVMTQTLVREGAEARVIGDQYRSDPPMVDAVNAIFERLFPELPHDPNVFRPSYKALRAARTECRRELDARITLLHAQHEEKSARHFAQAEAIAEWIRSNRDGGPNDLQRFAILFRRLTVLDDYLETFRRYGIEFVLPPTRLFLDRRAPVDLIAVLRAIAWPFDLGAQVSAARTPYFALTDVEIAAGFRESGDSDDGSSWVTFSDSIARFREASRHLTVSGLIDLVIETTGIESVYAAMADEERNLSHLEHVRAIAFEYDTREGGSVRQFVEEITRRRGEPEETEPSLVDESQNAVRIMSVHAAKGLEFDTVILPDLAFQPSGNDTLQLFTVEQPRRLVLTGRAQTISANVAPDDPKEPLKKISRAREEAESLRLFYVAVTRAKTDVVFVVNPEDRKTGFQKALLSVVGDLQWPESGREVRETGIGAVAFERLPPPSQETSRVRRRLRDPLLERELADSGIVPWTNVIPEAPVEILTPAEVAARRAGSRNRSAGILLHRVLELWDGAANVEALLVQLAHEAAADADAVARVRRRLRTIVRSPTHQRILRAETIGREMPIRFVEDGNPVERRIDRLIREDGRELVVDYKSGSAEPSRIARDRVQVARYADAIRAISGRPCSALLWYIDLENDEAVEC